MEKVLELLYASETAWKIESHWDDKVDVVRYVNTTDEVIWRGHFNTAVEAVFGLMDAIASEDPERKYPFAREWDALRVREE